MMTGVLVIAFPVSVFSDLWSKELKRSGAFAALEEDDDDDDDDNDDMTVNAVANQSQKAEAAQKLVDELDEFASPIKAGPYGVIAAVEDVNQSVESLPSQLPSMKRGQSNTSLNRNQVAMDRDDLINLLSHVQTMQESQREIKAILRKYKLSLQQISSGHD